MERQSDIPVTTALEVLLVVFEIVVDNVDFYAISNLSTQSCPHNYVGKQTSSYQKSDENNNSV